MHQGSFSLQETSQGQAPHIHRARSVFLERRGICHLLTSSSCKITLCSCFASFLLTILLPFCSFAVNISKLARGKHTVAIAKSVVRLVKKSGIKFRIMCQAITKTGHRITMEPRGFSKTLKPMLTARAPSRRQDLDSYQVPMSVAAQTLKRTPQKHHTFSTFLFCFAFRFQE